MTEREIPDAAGFLFGGMTDDSNTVSAPPAVREPENSAVATPVPVPAPVDLVEPSAAPVFLSRRELRAAGAYEVDAAAPAAPAPAATSYPDVASLFPLLGDVTAAALDAPLAPPSPFDAIVTPASVAVPVAAPALTTPVASTPLAAPVSTIPVPPTPLSPTPPVNAHRAPSNKRRPTSQRPPSPRPGSTRTTGHDSEARKSLRQRLFGVGVMVLVGGLFAVLAIPAYADNDATALTAAAAVQTQKVAVAGAAASTITTAARDSYTATSAADLKALYANALRQQAIEAYLLSGAKAKGDDYPWFAEPTRAEGGGLSPLGYYYRECVDFVAWRLNRDAGAGPNGPFPFTWSYLTPNGGDGHDWKPAWVAHGWATGTTPKPGAVAWFFDNHVGYVNGILDDGQVLIEEYNYTPHAYSQRVIDPSQAYYLYAPPLP